RVQPAAGDEGAAGVGQVEGAEVFAGLGVEDRPRAAHVEVEQAVGADAGRERAQRGRRREVVALAGARAVLEVVVGVAPVVGAGRGVQQLRGGAQPAPIGRQLGLEGDDDVPVERVGGPRGAAQAGEGQLVDAERV
ncbi:MAG: hypothetical protein ACK559_28470, partial [bacterium]